MALKNWVVTYFLLLGYFEALIEESNSIMIVYVSSVLNKMHGINYSISSPPFPKSEFP